MRYGYAFRNGYTWNSNQKLHTIEFSFDIKMNWRKNYYHFSSSDVRLAIHFIFYKYLCQFRINMLIQSNEKKEEVTFTATIKCAYITRPNPNATDVTHTEWNIVFRYMNIINKPKTILFCKYEQPQSDEI